MEAPLVVDEHEGAPSVNAAQPKLDDPQMKTPQDIQFERPESTRKYKFLELFAGKAGLSREVTRVCGNLVEVLDPLDVQGDWNVLEEEGFARARQAVLKADHTHLAFPCRSFSRARRVDGYGAVPVIRTDERPEGWGHPTAEEGNRILEKVIALIYVIEEAEKTWSMENPERSYAWDQPKMKKILKMKGVHNIELDQCPYGAHTKKGTRIVTTSDWMSRVKLKCEDVRPHFHLPGGLTGKTWDPIAEDWVWKTSRAAEYPFGLCQAWAEALLRWLQSPGGYEWLAKRTMVRTKAHQLVAMKEKLNALKRRRDDLAAEKMKMKEARAEDPSSRTQLFDGEKTKAEIREEENFAAVGGLRDPRKAVANSKALRTTGHRIRSALELCIGEQDLKHFEHSMAVRPETVQKAVQVLHEEFEVNEATNIEGYQTSLLGAMLEAACDADAQVVPRWLNEGVPLGLSVPIEHTNVFPATDEVSASIKASQAMGILLEDWDGEATNYASFYEAGSRAQAELDRMVETGRADRAETWAEVVALVGPEAKLTQLACIEKEKDGKIKTRLIVDMRRSGVNGCMKLFERVCLPRVSDVACSARELLKDMHSDETLEFMVIDFSDAFYTLHLKPEERKWVCIKAIDGSYILPKCICFGLACGPVLWGRVAASAMRLAQACFPTKTARLQCYVDDPIIVAKGRTSADRSFWFLQTTLLWTALGFKLAWHKAKRGTSIDWIGVQLTLAGDNLRHLMISLPPDKVAKVIEAMQAVETCKGVISTKRLEQLCGLLSWVSHLIPIARPWTSQLWAAVAMSKDRAVTGPKRAGTRRRKGLTFGRQVAHPIRWLRCLMESKGCLPVSDGPPPLVRTFRWDQNPKVVRVETDAPPTGLGGVLFVGEKPTHYIGHVLTEQDCKDLGGNTRLHDPAYQSEFELLAIFVSVKLFSQLFEEQCIQFYIHSDSTSALHTATTLRGKSPLMSQLAGEIALTLESFEIDALWGRHLRGVLNVLADPLSRLSEGSTVPESLQDATRMTVPALSSLFRAWPDSHEG